MMAPASQVSGPFTIQASIGKYRETRPRRRRVFALQLKLAGATTGDGMEVEQLSQGSGCCRPPPRAELTLSAIDQPLEHSDQGRTKDGHLREAAVDLAHVGRARLCGSYGRGRLRRPRAHEPRDGLPHLCGHAWRPSTRREDVASGAQISDERSLDGPQPRHGDRFP